ncbi:glycosyltransferase family 2 protein [Thermoflexibacter ruber]|uniref:Dolichol-phosphate mannosyltransferase n=1 Tax=Thermoflexibacter ruber TaxID=1003 RepID=A0A1I2JR90_9BACT|nr:glycosyltransferase family 2 protein [Thermoflexibacter ruber]SFF55276.1 dolichol-phosphate mannosyltransferase [Thermoflexibacter ruber]
MIDISIVIPIYNEALNINLLYERLTKVLLSMGVSYELIFVNDGSKDNSISLLKFLAAKHQEVKYIDLSRNFGHQIAVSAGLDKTTGKRVVIIDADLQDPPELIADLYAKMNEGYEVVYAKRKRRKGESFLKLLTAKLFYRILSNITSIHIPVDTGDFRLMDSKVVEALRQMPERHKFLRGQISWVGYRQTFIAYERDERHAGKTGYTYRKMFRFALDGITAFSNFPIKLVTVMGFLVSIVAFLMIIYTFYVKYFTNQDVERGWASLMVAILFLGGVQLISIGILGEYISRINTDVRKRPLYFIKESNI